MATTAFDPKEEIMAAMKNVEKENDIKNMNTEKTGSEEKETENTGRSIAEIFKETMKDFKKFVTESKFDEDGLEEYVKEFYRSSLFEKEIEKLGVLFEKAGIAPPFVSPEISAIYEYSEKKIKELRKAGIIENDEKLNAKNFLNRSYVEAMESAAREKGIDISADDIYRWLVLKPVYYQNDRFMESVIKVTGISEEEIAMEKNEIKPFDYKKEEEIKKVYSNMEILPSNAGGYVFGIQRVENAPYKTLKEVSDRLYFFDPDDAYQKIPSLKNDITFQTFAKNNVVDALRKASPLISEKDIEEIIKINEEFKKKHSIGFLPGEDQPYAMQGIFLKREILEEIKDRIKDEKAKEALEHIIKIQEKIKESVKRYVLTTSVNGWVLAIPEETLKTIEEKNYNLIYKNGEAYYFNETGEKINVELGTEPVDERMKEDLEIMRELVKTENEMFGGANKFVTGNLYKADEEGNVIEVLGGRRLTEALSRKNGESFKIGEVEYQRTNFDTEFFDHVYGTFSKRDAWYELITITKQKYGLSSSKEAIDKIREDGMGVLVIEKSKEELEKYKNEGLKALSLVKTNTFLNEDGSVKNEFTKAKNAFFREVFTRSEREYFEEESERLLERLSNVKRKINTYRQIMDESAEALFNGVADFAVKKYLKGDSSFKNKEDLLNKLLEQRDEFENDRTYKDITALLKQLIKRDKDIGKKIKRAENIVSFAKTNLEQSTDLKLTSDYKEKTEKIFEKSIKEHFFGKVFKETNLFKEFAGPAQTDALNNNLYLISEFNFQPGEYEKLLDEFKDEPEDKKAEKIFEKLKESLTEGKMHPLLNYNEFKYIHPLEYNAFETNLVNFNEAEDFFEILLEKAENVGEIEHIINDLKEGRLRDEGTISSLIDKSPWAADYGLRLEKDEQAVKEFLKRNKMLYMPLEIAAEISARTGIDPSFVGIDDLSYSDLMKVFNAVKEVNKEKFASKWSAFVNFKKQNVLGESLDVIYRNISKEGLENAFKTAEKHGLNKEELKDTVKKYAFLKEMEKEFSVRREIYRLVFEKNDVINGIFPPRTKEEAIHNLKLLQKKYMDGLKDKNLNLKNYKNDKILAGINNLLLMLDMPGVSVEIGDIKKALVPRENIDKVFGLFKEHVVENNDGIMKYEEELSKAIEKSFREIETAKYNEYAGMFEQLRNMFKNNEFSYETENVLRETYFNKLDETTIENYKNRMIEEHNIISNLNSLYGDMVYTAVRKSYDSIKTKNEIEELLDLSKKGLLPIMVREDERESFVITITEKEAEDLFRQYTKIFDKIKKDYLNEEGELDKEKLKTLSEREEDFIKQLYLLNKLDFPHNKDPRKKEKLNAITSLMLTLNGGPLLEKEDLQVENKRIRAHKDLGETFGFLSALDKSLRTVSFSAADMSVDEYQKFKERNDPEKEIPDYNKDRESFAYLTDDLEAKLLTISTEIDALDGRMKTIKSEMMSLQDKYERRFNENLRNNRALNGSMFENAFNFARFPLLMFEAFQIGVETAKKVVGEYMEYRRKIIPLKEEIDKRKKDLIIFMNEAQKTEEQIATEIQEFYMGFYSQNYNTMEEMIAVIEKMDKNGNKFAQHILNNPAIAERDENGKVISINVENLNKELRKTKNLLYGVYRTGKGGYRNVESLARARSRIKAMFAESQPNLFTLFFGSKEMIYYDDIADFRIRKLTKAKFEVKENAKEILVGNVLKENVKTLRKYTDINKVLFHLEKFKANTILRSDNGTLMMFNIDEKALSELRKQLAKKDNLTVDEALEEFLKISSLYTIDYENFSDLNSIIKSLKNNSELSKRIESELFEKDVLRTGEKFKTGDKIKEAVLKLIINPNILTEEETELLNKAGINQNEIERFLNKREILNLVQQSLHKVYFNTTKRFFEKEDNNKYASPNFGKILKDAEKVTRKNPLMTEEEFEKKYKIKVSDLDKIKRTVKEDVKNIIIDNVDLYEYDETKNKRKFGGAKLSNTTKLLAEDGSDIVRETAGLIDNMENKFEEIENTDGMRHNAKIKEIKRMPPRREAGISI